MEKETKKIYIKEQYFINNGDLMLPSIKDASGNSIKTSIESWLNQDYELVLKKRKKKGVLKGYDADNLNAILRSKMNAVSGIHGETFVEYGSILHSGKKGFDFSLFDENYYATKLRNAFIGNPGRYKGDEALRELNKKVVTSDGTTYKKKDWTQKILDMGLSLIHI